MGRCTMKERVAHTVDRWAINESASPMVYWVNPVTLTKDACYDDRGGGSFRLKWFLNDGAP